MASVAFAGSPLKAGPANELADLNAVWGDFSFQTDQTLFPENGLTSVTKIQNIYLNAEGEEARKLDEKYTAISKTFQDSAHKLEGHWAAGRVSRPDFETRAKQFRNDLDVAKESFRGKNTYCQMGTISGPANQTIPAKSTLIFSESSQSEKVMPNHSGISIAGFIKSSQTDRSLKIYLKCPGHMTLQQIERLLARRLNIKGSFAGTLGVRTDANPVANTGFATAK